MATNASAMSQPAPHVCAARQMVLDGELADRFRANAAQAVTPLLDKYWWALFRVGSDNRSAISQLAADAMTWDGLIHTIYFDHPELASAIAEHIAAEATAAARH